MTTPAAEAPSWREYYQKMASRPPRPLLQEAIAKFTTPGVAVDLGCGGGIETGLLLHNGWQVLALDQEPAALDWVSERTRPADRSRLTVQCATFAEVVLLPADLIWAGLSLPFCAPPEFPRLWQKIVASLRSGGRFAGDLFGDHHAWRDQAEMTFLTRADVDGYLRPLTVEHLVESEEERQTAFRGMQHWHGFDIIARKDSDVPHPL